MSFTAEADDVGGFEFDTHGGDEFPPRMQANGDFGKIAVLVFDLSCAIL
jgi:hypothetical protein